MASCIRLEGQIMLLRPDLPEQACYRCVYGNAPGRERGGLWAALWPVCNILESHNYVAAIKAGLDEIGLSAGPLRAPLQPISAADSAELAVTLRRAQAL